MSERTMTAAKVSTAEEPLLVLDRPRPGVTVLTLNRPAARNALSVAMLEALDKAFATLGADNTVAAIVLAANGPVFSSGHDLKELTAHRADADKGLAFYSEAMTRCSAMMQAIIACPKPVIAAVQGTATAAGCQLVATCDLAIAADNAQLCTPGVNIGLFCSTPMVALSRNVGRKRAMEMLLTGDMLSAADAVEYGLINRAVPTADLLPQALDLAEKIAAKSPLTVAIGKRAFYAQAEMPLAEAYAYAAQVMVDNMMTRDAEEGIGAFLGKRPPEWKGR
jgi:enoyl-CoA hydratase/carnithine racemase